MRPRRRTWASQTSSRGALFQRIFNWVEDLSKLWSLILLGAEQPREVR
jgi:hypothetical protein